MFDFFCQSTAHFGYVWLIAGVSLLLFEVGAPGLFLFTSLAIGAFFAAAIAFNDVCIHIQCLTGLAVSVVAFFVLRRYIVRWSTNDHKTNSDALVGQEAVVVSPLGHHKIGRVKVGGEEWAAITTQGNAYQNGTVVLVVAVQGNKLVVQ
ncbi:MAG: NfeD family protein [Candidatus Babeliales bacterium]|jgi:membrane protein implicated in regulation of membrane protease activity